MNFRILILFGMVLLAGCKASEDKLVEEIISLEKSLGGTGDGSTFNFDSEKAKEIIRAYEDFVQKYPKSNMSPEMLLKSADLHRALKKYDIAINIYQRIENEYQDFDKLPQVIFLEGYVYENEMDRLEKAKKCYESFLEKYPDHELADDVQFSLKNLGKSPEEIIKEFEKQNLQTASDSIPS